MICTGLAQALLGGSAQEIRAFTEHLRVESLMTRALGLVVAYNRFEVADVLLADIPRDVARHDHGTRVGTRSV